MATAGAKSPPSSTNFASPGIPPVGSGNELMIIIVTTILTLNADGHAVADNCLVYLGAMRILLGLGFGGDYPMASTIMPDRAVIQKRGPLLSCNFSNKVWGSLVGSLFTMIVLLAYRTTIEKHGELTIIDGV